MKGISENYLAIYMGNIPDDDCDFTISLHLRDIPCVRLL